CTAGKNLNVSRPCSSPRISSEDVATPGRNGRSTSRAAAYSRSVAPGETAKRPPTALSCCSCVASSTVPAPITASGTASTIALIASIARGVRSVTSITGRPPRNRALATCTASSMSSGVNTAITGASFRTARTRGSAPDIELSFAHQGHHVGHADRVEISGNGVLQAAGGQPEADRGLAVEAFDQAVQHAGSERVTTANAVDDAGQLLFRRHRTGAIA